MGKSRNIFEVLFGTVNDFYENLFYKYGVILSKHYKAIITGSFICNIILALCILNIRVLNDIDDLYFLTDSRAKYEEKYIKSIFNESSELESKYFVHQSIDLGTWAEINFHVAADADANILQIQYLNEIRHIHHILMEKTKVIHENSTLGFFELCAKRFDECALEGVGILNEKFLHHLKEKSHEIYENEETFINSNPMSLFDPYYDKESKSVTFLSYSLGRHFRYIPSPRNITNPNHEYAYTNIIKLRYTLNSPGINKTKIAKEWEEEFLRQIQMIRSNLTSFTFSTSETPQLELDYNLRLDFPLYIATVLLIAVFAIILMSINTNLLTTPCILLPIAGIASAAFGLFSAMGLMSIVGYECCRLVIVVPFLVLG